MGELNGCIFFDLGWTLEDESKAQIRRAEKAASISTELGVDTTANRILELQEEGAEAFAPSVFRYALKRAGLSEKQVYEVEKRAVWDKSRLCLYRDARPVLAHFHRRCFLGLIANQSPGTAERLRSYGIAGYFDLVFASAELGLAKPEPAIFAAAIEQSGCASENAWMVGDRLDNDIRPAKKAGWHTIRILKGYNRKQHPRDELDVPDHTIASLGEIVDIISVD